MRDESHGRHGNVTDPFGQRWLVSQAPGRSVDDVEADLARIRSHGGRTGEPETQPCGVIADCADEQGVEFWLWQIPTTRAAPRHRPAGYDRPPTRIDAASLP